MTKYTGIIPRGVETIYSIVPIPQTDMWIMNNQYIISESDGVLVDDRPIVSASIEPDLERIPDADKDAVSEHICHLGNLLHDLSKMNYGIAVLYELGKCHDANAARYMCDWIVLNNPPKLDILSAACAIDVLWGINGRRGEP